jgi:hypothetical protein
MLQAASELPKHYRGRWPHPEIRNPECSSRRRAQLACYAGSIVASSTSIIGISSRTGYTRRHSLHFRLVPSSFWASGFLHTGHTKMSINSFSTIAALYAGDWTESKPPLRRFVFHIIRSRTPRRLTSSPLPEYISLHGIFVLFQFFGSRTLVMRRDGKRVQIPRCRATVSEETRGCPLKETSGRMAVVSGR